MLLIGSGEKNCEGNHLRLNLFVCAKKQEKKIEIINAYSVLLRLR